MAKLRKCKSCGADVAKTAKWCPQCGAKQHNGAMTAVVLIILVTVFLIAAMCTKMVSEDDGQPKLANTQNPSKITETSEEPDSTTETAAPSTPTVTEPPVYTIGDTLEHNDVLVTLTDLRTSAGSTYIAPTAGNVFMVFEFDIQNNSDSDLGVSSLLCFSAYVDDYSQSISLTAMSSDEGQQLDGSVAAGKKMRGIYGIEAPEDWSTAEVRFKPSVWGGSEFVFTVSRDQVQ